MSLAKKLKTKPRYLSPQQFMIQDRQRKEDLQRELDKALTSSTNLIVAHEQRIVSLPYTRPKDKIKKILFVYTTVMIIRVKTRKTTLRTVQLIENQESKDDECQIEMINFDHKISTNLKRSNY